MRPRFAVGWTAWDRAIADGRTPDSFLPEISDDELIELLGSGGESRTYEHDLLTIELQNRLLRARRDLASITEAIVGVNDRIRANIQHARRVANKAKEVAEEARALAEESVGADERLVAHLEASRLRARGKGAEEPALKGPTRFD